MHVAEHKYSMTFKFLSLYARLFSDGVMSNIILVLLLEGKNSECYTISYPLFKKMTLRLISRSDYLHVIIHFLRFSSFSSPCEGLFINLHKTKSVNMHVNGFFRNTRFLA